ncbi:PcfB family protein [Eubacterium ventriosum]|uniref:PcfB family protein n=2 Tax=Eubacteriaceae TaxID=186806 RepID=A0A414R9Q6_9FIRM|nr:PcfB family protein [Eubacterium ventriosum]
MGRGGERMSDEISQAIQIIRLEFDGLRFGMDVTGGTVKQAKNLAVFIYALLTREKIQGKTSLKKMLSKDGSLQVLKIREEDMKKFKKLAKKYGILYSKLPDINKSDGMTEVLFHTEATPRINTLIEKLGNGSIENLMDYVRNGKDGDFEKVVDYLKKENILKDTPSEVEPERKEQLDRYADELKYNAMINDPSRVDITISRKLYEEENLTSIKTRVPNTYGDNVRYLWIDKSDVVSINGGKTFFAYLNKDKEYELVDRDGRIAEKLTGQNLQKQHYDNVDVNVKHRALQEQRRGKSEKKQKDKKVGTPGPKVRKTESVKGSPRGR